MKQRKIEMIREIAKGVSLEAKEIQKGLTAWNDSDLRKFSQAKKELDFKTMYNLVADNGMNPANIYVKELKKLADEQICMNQKQPKQ